MIQNYCPFEVTFQQKESLVQYSIPPYSQFDYYKDEPLKEDIYQVVIPGMKNIECEVHPDEDKRMSIPALVTLKEECQLVTDVYFQIRGKWKVRTARLGDHVLFLYKRAKFTKKLRGGHSSLSLALPLRNVFVKHRHSTVSSSVAVRQNLYAQAISLASFLPATFTLNQLIEGIEMTFPRCQSSQLIQDFISIGILYKLPQDVSTPMVLQQEPIYAFRSHPISRDCCVSLFLIGTKIELYFANAEIAGEWAVKLRFEAESAPRFPPENWLGVNPRYSEIRDIDFFIQFQKQGPVPVISIAPLDFPTGRPTSASFIQNNRTEISIEMEGVGLSLVNAIPEDCCYFFVDGIDFTASLSSENQDVNLNIQNIQFDINAYDASFPCILYTLRRELTAGAPALPVEGDSKTATTPQSPLASPIPKQNTRVSSNQRHQILSNLTKQEKETQQLVEAVEKKGKQVVGSCPSCGYVFKGKKRPFLHACGQRHCGQQNCMHINRGLVVLEKIVLKVDELFMVRLRHQFDLLFVFVNSWYYVEYDSIDLRFYPLLYSYRVCPIQYL